MPLFSEAYAPARAGGLDAWSVFGTQPETLGEITRPEVNLAVWARPLPPGIASGCAKLARAAPFRAAAEGRPEEAVAAVAEALPGRPPFDLLLDLHELSLCFAMLIGSETVQLRLCGIDGDGCKRFHADAVGLRLLCTYRGAGTEWLPLAGAAAGRSLGGAAPPANRLPAGAVALLKGEGLAPGRGCVHRSPPRGPHDPARLVLTLDEPGRIPL
ncbi:MAG: DUF1826 domain-containing protein [Paracraurococcus sp.]